MMMKRQNLPHRGPETVEAGPNRRGQHLPRQPIPGIVDLNLS